MLHHITILFHVHTSKYNRGSNLIIKHKLIACKKYDNIIISDQSNKPIILWTRFDYKPVCNPFAITHYVVIYKTIHMYYLKKSHDLLNKSCD